MQEHMSVSSISAALPNPYLSPSSTHSLFVLFSSSPLVSKAARKDVDMANLCLTELRHASKLVVGLMELLSMAADTWSQKSLALLTWFLTRLDWADIPISGEDVVGLRSFCSPRRFGCFSLGYPLCSPCNRVSSLCALLCARLLAQPLRVSRPPQSPECEAPPSRSFSHSLSSTSLPSHSIVLPQ